MDNRLVFSSSGTLSAVILAIGLLASPPSPASTPLQPIAAIAAGAYHTCALTSGGGVKCWGYNFDGELGDNSTMDRLTPVDVSGLASGVAAITAGDSHTCALTTGGGVKCWGRNFAGELGDNTTTKRVAPVDVSGLASGVVAITAGGAHTCALTTGGGVQCWGFNSNGQLGDNSAPQRLTPAAVPGLTSGVAAIAAGSVHTCALTTEGGVKCWGSNGSGELGDNSTTQRFTPGDVSGLASGVAAITTGGAHTCALTIGGGVKCWGYNTFGQVGDNSTTVRLTPVDVSGLASGVVAITAGGNHTCALSTGGGVQCWGRNLEGELGDNSTKHRFTPVAVSELASGVAAITGGLAHTCALSTGGDVKCWGYNDDGELGDNTRISRLTPVAVSGLTGPDTTPDPFAFPSRTGVTIFAPQVSDPVTPTGYTSPAPISVANGTYSIGCGFSYTYISTPGTIDPGQSVCVQHYAAATGESVTTTLTIGGVSGTFTTTTLGGAVLAFSPPSVAFGNQAVGTTSPGQVVTLTNSGAGGSTFLSGTTGDFSIASQTCGISLPANASCTFTVAFTPAAKGARTGTLGVFNGAGTLSAGLAGTGTSPDTGDSAAIAAGGAHTCALTVGGGIKCWGLNFYGQLGDNSIADHHTPADVPGLTSGVAAITAGHVHTCVLTMAGGVQCWGNNGNGQLGDNSGTTRLVPVSVSGLASGVAAISAGGSHTCALTSGGGVKCWGFNLDGTLGDGSTVQRLTPVAVSGLASGVAAISAGETHTCALTTAGGVKCWGSNSLGQLGDNSTTVRLTPVDVSGLASGVAAISAGGSHTCALTAGGGVKCWGNNGNGQLGDNSTTKRIIAVTVSGLGSGATAISAGGSHTCALTTGGGVKCWGYNSSGQLGDNSTTDRLIPVAVSNFASGVMTIAAGGDHSCAFMSSGSAKCWGRNEFGQLGDNSLVNRLTPVSVLGFAGTDATPDAFTFPSRSGVVLFGPQVSDPMTPTGYDAPASISVANGTYSIGCGFSNTYTSTPGTINPGQSVCVQHNAAAVAGQSVTTTLTIGGVVGTFTTTTAGAAVLSLTPASLAFGNQAVATTSAGRVVTLTNSGASSAGVLPGVTGDFSVSSTTCSASLPANASCTINVVFTPTSAGARAGNLIVSITGTPSVGLAGTGTIPGQTIVFGPLLDRAVGMAPFTVHATASSGLAVSFGSPTPAVCTVSGSTVTLVSVGNCTIAANQAGNANFGVAPQVTRSFAVANAPNPNDIVAMALGGFHTCALTAVGGVKCWGDNGSGQLGDNSTTDRLAPADVSGLASGVAAIAAGGSHTCALTTAGGVKCWGYNFYGQLGDNSTTQRLIPVDVLNLTSGIAAIAAGGRHTCALTIDGNVACWGYNQDGELGNSSIPPSNRLTPISVSGLAGVVAAIAAGDRHTCALMTGGGVKCWGANFNGQLGDNSTTNRRSPVDVSGLASGVAAIAPGAFHTCALTTGGGVKCWGSNSDGQIGDNSMTPHLTPVDVSGLASGMVAIAAGYIHTCGLKTGGGMMCWGSNSDGQLGDNSMTSRLIPVDVPGLASGVAAIAAGEYRTCAITTRGGALCWGNNSNGQLGDNTTTDRLIPVNVSGLTGIDTTPGPLVFTAQTGVIIGTTRTSNAITPAGYYDPAPVSVANGEYSIGCAASFTAVAGTINPGDAVCVRHVASSGYSQSVTTTLTIGGVAGAFTSTTAPPPALSLSAASLAFGNQPVGTTSAGRAITVSNAGVHEATGLGWGVIGDFSIASTTCGSTLAGNSSCTITVAFTPLSLGGRADEMLVFSANGVPSLLRVLLSGTGTISDVTPNAFSFVDQFLVATNAVVTSAPVQVTGLTSAAPVTVIGGTFAVSSTNACTGDVVPFGVSPAMMANNQYVCVRHTSSAVAGGSNDTQLIVGGLGDTFTTVTRDTVPAAFALGPQSNVAPSTLRTSAAVAISGINAPAPFTVAGGEISVNCNGTFASSGSLAPGSSLCARHMAGGAFNATTTTTVTVGGVQASFVTTTFDANGDADDDGIPNGVEYNEARNPEAKDNDVFTNNRLFAMQQYRDFLGREGDAGGITSWVNYLEGGGTRAAVAEGFFGSPEFQGTGSPVARLYFAYFLRIPDYGGLTFWMSYYRTGHSLFEISNAFAGSQEFVDRYGALTNPQFVDLVYQNVLGRAPDAGGRAFWIGRLNGGMTRGEMMIGFSESAEYQSTIFSDTYVTMMYVGMLRRAPDSGGVTFWVNYIDSGNSGQALINGFLQSPEYRNRFLP